MRLAASISADMLPICRGLTRPRDSTDISCDKVPKAIQQSLNRCFSVTHRIALASDESLGLGVNLLQDEQAQLTGINLNRQHSGVVDGEVSEFVSA
jgi:hypothetical protein